jgi:hypothetical protein
MLPEVAPVKIIIIKKPKAMNRILLLFSFMICILFPQKGDAANYLFRSGHTNYDIVLSPNASTSEVTAANELSSYLSEISGANFIVSKTLSSNRNHIFVGYDKKQKVYFGRKPFSDADESFTYFTLGNNVVIYGGRQRGTMYGVFTFLENLFNVRWYTPSFTVVPKKHFFLLSKINHSEHPALQYRYTNYFPSSKAPQWSAHNKENMAWTPKPNSYGNVEGYWNAHTTGQFIPAGEFFKSHPEYFAMRDGKRVDNGQLCLTNPDVIKICRERLLKRMAQSPEYRIYSLSQNDNFNFCQCPRCKAIEDKYGAHSGLILWFVNQIADSVKKYYPDKYVGTFAYQYTRQAPHGIAPRDNVVIRLCSIECCFAHPISNDGAAADSNNNNKSFMKDLNDWRDIAPHLFIWDYVVDFAQFMAPWPNFNVLAPNIRTFRDNHAIGIFEEAQYISCGAEFEELKNWVLLKLLWNPDQSTDALVRDFVYGYYGKAAPDVMKYYELCQSLVKPNTHFGIYINENDPIYSDEFISKGFDILASAERLADNAEIKEHVNKISLQLLYLKSVRHREQTKADGTWDKFMQMAKKYDARPNEAQFLKDFK